MDDRYVKVWGSPPALRRASIRSGVKASPATLGSLEILPRFRTARNAGLAGIYPAIDVNYSDPFGLCPNGPIPCPVLAQASIWLSLKAIALQDALQEARAQLQADIRRHPDFYLGVAIASMEATSGAGGTGGEVRIGEYLAKKAPRQVAPGVRQMNGVHQNDRGRVEPWVAHYDQYGRLVARTDYNAGNRKQSIPDIHHHTYDPRTGQELRSHVPGEYKP